MSATEIDLDDRRQRLKHKMTEARQELVQLLLSLTPQQLKLPTNNEGWTVYDVAAHIAGAEGGMEVIANRILAHEPSMVPDFDINRFNNGNIRRRQGKTMPQLVDELNASRVRMLALLDNVTEEQLDLPGKHPTAGETTLYGLMVVIYRHERTHADDIRQALQAANITQPAVKR